MIVGPVPIIKIDNHLINMNYFINAHCGWDDKFESWVVKYWCNHAAGDASLCDVIYFDTQLEAETALDQILNETRSLVIEEMP